MKNPYLYGYLPLITILLFSMTFGIFVVTESLTLFKAIGVYSGMREFLSDIEIRVLLLIIVSLIFFMLFSALKLIGETIHEIGLLFFLKNSGEMVSNTRGGYVIFFFGAVASVFGIQSIIVLILVFLLTTICYFIYVIYKLSFSMSTGGMIGMIFFEILVWVILCALILYAVLKLYNGILASLPFAN